MKKDANPAKNPLIKLQVCECGKLHLTYGSLTLHFEQFEFQEFAASINSLARQLGKIPSERIIPITSQTNGNGSH